MRTEAEPRSQENVLELGGQRYFLATKDMPGGRSWVYELDTSQGAGPQQAAIPIASFHEGGGFSYAGMPNTYEQADGWDASVPGRLATWARHGTGDQVTLAAAPLIRGWLEPNGGYLYMFRGRYASKYTINATPGSVWAKGSDNDFGSSLEVCGRPHSWKGKVFVPLWTASTQALAQWKRLTTGSPDTWDIGPSSKPAR